MRSIFGALLMLPCFWQQPAEAQSVIGFWKVEKVMVGAVDRTPVAKWIKINQDKSYQSGNGGIQNAEGAWSLDTSAKIFVLSETNGLKDPFGGFNVRVDGEQMVWEREEEGEIVTVSLEKTIKPPKSTADMLVGLWDLTDILRHKTSEMSKFDPKDRHYIFIRWDRVYVERTPEEQKVMGYWHINAHRPEITFLCDDGGKSKESWIVDVTETQLRMVGVSDFNKGIEKFYTRIHEFPK